MHKLTVSYNLNNTDIINEETTVEVLIEKDSTITKLPYLKTAIDMDCYTSKTYHNVLKRLKLRKQVSQLEETETDLIKNLKSLNVDIPVGFEDKLILSKEFISYMKTIGLNPIVPKSQIKKLNELKELIKSIIL